MAPTQSAPASLNTQVEALSFVTVDVPDLLITHINGADYPEIPEGSRLLVPGRPQLPAYQMRYEYPDGYQVQDVTGRPT